MQKPVPFAALVGIDWADKKHDICLCATGSTKRERAVIPHTPAAAYSAENDRVDRVGDREDRHGDQTRADDS